MDDHHIQDLIYPEHRHVRSDKGKVSSGVMKKALKSKNILGYGNVLRIPCRVDNCGRIIAVRV